MHASSDVDARGSEHTSDAATTSKRWRQRDAIARPHLLRSFWSRLVVVLIAVLMMPPAAFNRGAPSASLPAAVGAPAHAHLVGTPVPPPLITFTGPTEYAYGTVSRPSPNPYNVAMVDVNGDGNLDLVVDETDTSSGNYSVRVEFGDGHGGFSESAGYLLTNAPGRLVVTPLTSGGKPDIVVGQGSAGVAVLTNNGDGTFSGPTYYSITWPAGSSGGAVVGPAVADVSGDGKVDIVTGDGALSGISGYGHPEGFYSVL